MLSLEGLAPGSIDWFSVSAPHPSSVLRQALHTCLPQMAKVVCVSPDCSSLQSCVCVLSQMRWPLCQPEGRRCGAGSLSSSPILGMPGASLFSLEDQAAVFGLVNLVNNPHVHLMCQAQVLTPKPCRAECGGHRGHAVSWQSSRVECPAGSAAASPCVGGLRRGGLLQTGWSQCLGAHGMVPASPAVQQGGGCVHVVTMQE